MPTVAATFDPDVVTTDDLSVILDTSPDSETGYCGVFKHRNRYRAVAFHLRVGEVQPTARAAAVQLVRFWKHWFGPSWAGCFRAKKGHPWSFVRCQGGYRVLVYLLGRPFFLGAKRRKGRTLWVPVMGQGAVFASKAEGRAAYRLFVWGRYGMFQKLAGLEVRRDGFAAGRVAVQVPHGLRKCTVGRSSKWQ